jgi:hypothetical protein
MTKSRDIASKLSDANNNTAYGSTAFPGSSTGTGNVAIGLSTLAANTTA